MIKKSKKIINKTSLNNDVFMVGFTLIELLGVIIVLGILGLIVFPIVNKSIRQSKENSLKETIRNIENAGQLYSIRNDIGYSETYNNLDINVLKEAGLLKNGDLINPVTDKNLEGCLLYRWVNKQYEFKYIEPCETAPSIAVKNKDGVFNENGWASNSFYVDINYNTEEYEYCVSDKECTPDMIGNSGNVYINNNGTNYVCVKATNDLGSTEVVCEEYKLDTNAPVLASTTIYFDKGDNKLTDLLDISTVSGHKISCDKTYISELELSDNNINCTITSNNGKTINQNIIFKPNRLKTAGYQVNTFLGSTTLKSKIETLTMLDYIEIPSDVEEVVDVSEAQNRSIMAWYVDEDKDDLYELYIGQSGGIIANPNSSFLFKNLGNVTQMDIRLLDTTNVTFMGEMFLNMSKLESLDVLNFDTSQVTNMVNMFTGVKKITELNLSNFDTSNVTNMNSMFLNMNSLIELDVSGFDTSKVTNMHQMFGFLYKVTELNVNGFNTANVTDMSYMFAGMVSLTELDVSNFDTSNVTDMGSMFSGCNNLLELDISNFDTSNVKNMNGMFARLNSLTELDLSNFNTSQVTNMSYMFQAMRNLTELDLSHFDTSQVTNMGNMFSEMQSLTSLNISRFDTAKVTNMYSMFYGCSILTELDVSHFDTSQVTDMGHMFSGMPKLTELDVSGFDTSEVINMSNMFQNMNSLISLDVSNFNTTKVNNMSRMFQGLHSVTTLDVSHFDTSQVTTMESMFGQCNKITNLDLSNFNTSNVINLSGMFAGIYTIAELDLSNFNMSKVTDVSSMFVECWGLKNINLTSINIDTITNYNEMFLYATGNPTILVKDERTKAWIENRLSETNTNAVVIVQ